MKKDDTGIEKHLADNMANRSVQKSEILQYIKELTAARFIMKEFWMNLLQDNSYEDWRRLEAYKLVINHCISYPCSLRDFMKDAVIPLGIRKNQVVNMSKAQVLPFKRKMGDFILMINLPITTATGPASVYLAVDRQTNMVERAKVFPDIVERGP